MLQISTHEDYYNNDMKKSYIYYINHLNEKLQKLFINENPYIIMSFSFKISLNVLLYAIDKCPRLIKYSENPSEDLQLAAVKSNHNDFYNVLKYIKNPTYKTKLLSVKKKGSSIKYIKEDEQTDELKLLAVKQYGANIEYIKNPTEEMKFEAIKSCKYAINYIKDPTEEMKLLSIENDPFSVSCIENVSDDLVIKSIDKYYNDHYNISEFISDISKLVLTHNVQKYIIDKYLDFIDIIDKFSYNNKILILSHLIFNKYKQKRSNVLKQYLEKCFLKPQSCINILQSSPELQKEPRILKIIRKYNAQQSKKN
jgi:hypothetical protein